MRAWWVLAVLALDALVNAKRKKHRHRRRRQPARIAHCPENELPGTLRLGPVLRELDDDVDPPNTIVPDIPDILEPDVYDPVDERRTKDEDPTEPEPEPIPELDKFVNLAEDVLDGRVPNTDRRYATIKLAMDIMVSKGHKTLVETGTARRGDKDCAGDGCSTVIWAYWAEQNEGMRLWSVDHSPRAVQQAMQAVRFSDLTTIVVADSVQFLREFSSQIDFLFLDSGDYDPNQPSVSQELALREIIAAFPKLTNESMLMVNGCGHEDGGKCTLVEIFMKEMGWRTLVRSHQLLMVSSKPVIL